MVHCDHCSAFILEFAMNDVVELILKTYQSMCPLDTERAADSRQKISRYIETLRLLASAMPSSSRYTAWRI
jgi:hypothetical protein